MIVHKNGTMDTLEQIFENYKYVRSVEIPTKM